MKNKPTHLDLFSGIGGFCIAAQNSGFNTIGFLENNNYASSILKQHWPSITNFGDITTFYAGNFRGKIDLLTGGFPCQPFSQAGKRRGKKDDRHLWPEMFRIIKECQPTWIIVENVIGIVKMELGQMLSDLESIGYDFPRDLSGMPIVPVIPACAINACHRRDRIWIISYSKHNGSSSTENRESDIERKNSNQKRENEVFEFERSNCSRIISEYSEDNSKDNELFNSNSESVGCNRRSQIKGRNGKSRLHKFERCTEALNWIEAATKFSRMDDGIPNRSHRIKSLGNAIVPEIAEIILKEIRNFCDE